MAKLGVLDASNAVSGIRALRAVMTKDLNEVEKSIHELSQPSMAHSEGSVNELQVYEVTRAALYSGLAGINEVLGWVNLMTEKDAEGNAVDVVRSLPSVPVSSIN